MVTRAASPGSYSFMLPGATSPLPADTGERIKGKGGRTSKGGAGRLRSEVGVMEGTCSSVRLPEGLDGEAGGATTRAGTLEG